MVSMRHIAAPLGLVAAATLGLIALTASQPATPELFAPGVISKPDTYESFGSLSPDGREFYFTAHQPNFSQHHIVVSRLIDGRWSTPEPTPFSTTWNDREPKLSPDGRRLYFSSNRPTDAGSQPGKLDLFMTERVAGGPWGPAERLPAPINTDVHEFCPVVIADGTLYFISARPGGIRGTEPTEIYNVWRAPALDKSGLRFGTPVNLGKGINTGLETNVYVTPDDRTMVVSRDGAKDGLGGDDLYVSTRAANGWAPLRHLPAPINSDKYEYGPSLTPDGKWLIFTSARAGTADIYRVAATALSQK